MFKIFSQKIVFILLMLVLTLTFFPGSASTEKPVIAVTIVPQIEMLREIAGDKIEIVEMIPPGSSPANYAPSPAEMRAFNEAEIYFSIGVPADIQNILPRAEDSDELKVVRLFEVVEDKFPHRYMDHSHEEDAHSHEEDADDHQEEQGRDPHIWLSPERSAYIVEIMRDNLIELMPEHEKEFRKNAADYLARLKEVDQKNAEVLSKYKDEKILVYHPSYGYFTEHYGLDMLAIEESGKEPGPRHISEIIDEARKENIKTVFYQAEIDSNKTRAIAEELNGDIVQLNPLAEDYLDNLAYIADAFAEVLEKRVKQ
ncbi:MAG: metal ABC transporter solute-binding protein, Zn/Mn family [Halanaerobium sp.]